MDMDVPSRTRDLLLECYRLAWVDSQVIWILSLPVLTSTGKAVRSTAGPSCVLGWMVTIADGHGLNISTVNRKNE